MAFKRVPGARLTPQPTESLPYRIASSVGTGLASIPRGRSALLGGIEAVTSAPFTGLALLLDYLSGGKTPVKELLTENIAETLKGPGAEVYEQLPEFFKREPKASAEFATQLATGQLPQILTGTVNPSTLLRSGLGIGGATGAFAAGGGPLAQTLAQLGTEGLYGALTRPSLKQKSDRAYAMQGPIGVGPEGPGATKTIIEDVGPIDKILKKIERIKDAKIKPSQKEVIQNLYDSLKSAKTIGGAELGKLFESRTALREAYKDLRKAGFSSLAKETRQALNEMIRGAESKLKDPQFWNSVTIGDKYKIADNIKTPLAEYIGKKIDNFPELPFKIQKTLNVVEPVVSGVERVVKTMLNDTAREHIVNLFTSVAEGKESDASKYLIKLGNTIEKTKESEKSVPKFRRVQGARLIT